MMNPLVIVAFVVVLLRGMVSEPFGADLIEVLAPGHLANAVQAVISPAGAVAFVIGGMAAVFIVMHLTVQLCVQRLDATGHSVWAWRADRAVRVSRLAGLLVHIKAVLGLGWVDAVRYYMGNPNVLDEIVAVAPFLLLVIGGWWSLYPVERRIREAILLRDLDAGRHPRPPVRRGQYVLTQVRHQMAMVVVPMALIMGWSELVSRTAEWGYQEGTGWLSRYPDGHILWGIVVLQAVGVLTVFAIMPEAMRYLWDTVPLGVGPVRERLDRLCAGAGVRVRSLLVWRTHGQIVNAAVIGVLRPMRYILLSDALLESLSDRQVEAVAAHEIGHIRRRHMPWLAVTIVSVVGLASWVLGHMTDPVRGIAATTGWRDVGESIGAFILGLAIFGFVSRRFEWQADAFAVQQLSLEDASESGAPPSPGRGVAVSPDAVAAMSGALAAVAALNGVPEHRWTWRHGSIATRRRRLAQLVGCNTDVLAIDRQVAWIKRCSVIGLLIMIALSFID